MAPAAPVPSMGAQLLAEFLGTFMLVFTVGCTVLAGNTAWGGMTIATSDWGGVSIALVLMVSIYALGGISGAHFNPAVSIALGISKAMGGRGIELKTVAIYCGMQFLGGITAAFSYSAMYKNTFNLQPAAGFGMYHAGMCEMIYTFMLCFVFLNVTQATQNWPNQFYGLAIGFAMLAGTYGAGAISGGYFNPAVSLGIDLASYTLGFGWCLAYFVFQVIGAVLAALLFRAVRPEDFGGEQGGALAEFGSEFLGSFMLVFTVGLNVLGKSPAAGLSIAASLASMTYALGNVSGAQFNPAVTFAVYMSGACPEETPQKTPAKARLFVFVQVVAGILAALAYSSVYGGGSFRLGDGSAYGGSSNAIKAAEFVFTFLLCYIFLCMTVSTTTHPPRMWGMSIGDSPNMFGLAIGACMAVGINAVGALSGGSLNPAICVGVATAHRLSEGSLSAAFVYSLFELFAGWAAALLFRFTHAADMAKDKIEGEETP